MTLYEKARERENQLCKNLRTVSYKSKPENNLNYIIPRKKVDEEEKQNKEKNSL